MAEWKHRSLPTRPSVWLVGETKHPDFHDAVAVLRDTAISTIAPNGREATAHQAAAPPPELILVAQSRAGAVGHEEVDRLERLAPLAGVVSLLGSWCEGEMRSGRPHAGVNRLYWYEFPTWWERQLVRRNAGLCPDWARPRTRDAARWQPAPSVRHSSAPRGLVVLCTPAWDSAEALADALTQDGYATAWQRTSSDRLPLREVAAGIWEGGQLDDAEADLLAAFCRQWPGDAAPVVALLDFPRRDRRQRALAAGAAAVLGKPWCHADLIDAIQSAAHRREDGVRTAVTRAA